MVLQDLKASPLTILDGGLATELERFGYTMASPWWTSAALRDRAGLSRVLAIHKAYIEAGAHVITANTFRTGLHALLECGLDREEAKGLVHDAIAVASQATLTAGRPDVRVAASIAPVRDCYRPDLTPDIDTLISEHRWHLELLAERNVKLILAETMNGIQEAEVVASIAQDLGISTWVSFACGPSGALLSGEPYRVAVQALERYAVSAVLVNCSTIEATTRALSSIDDLSLDKGFYLNNEVRDSSCCSSSLDMTPARYSPQEFARISAEITRSHGCSIVGGCCGSTPHHIKSLSDIFFCTD